MDFLGGALPNIMFIVGIIAIGIGLGIEFKVVEIKSEISKGGRWAAFSVGVVLIAASIFLYTQSRSVTTTPTPSAVEQPTSVPTDTNPAATDLVQATPVPTPPPAPTQPEITPAATVTPLPVPTVDPVAALQALFTAGMADGRAGKDVKDLLKKWEEFQGALSKGDEKKAKDHLRDLQKELQEAADKGKMDPLFVDEALASIQAIATQYELELPAAKP